MAAIILRKASSAPRHQVCEVPVLRLPRFPTERTRQQDTVLILQGLLDAHHFDPAYRVMMDPRKTYNGHLILRLAFYFMKRGVEGDGYKVHNLIRRGIDDRLFSERQRQSLVTEGRLRCPDALWVAQLQNATF